MAEQHQQVTVGGRRLKVSNLEKVLYPQAGTTKAEVLAYYLGVADALLRWVHDRPVTRKRWPDGVAGPSFFEKNAPRGTPDWVRTVTVPTPGSSRGRETLTFPLLDDVASLAWVANLAALELHVPQWTVGPRGAVRDPDRLVVDLDPGPGAGLDECAQVAHLVRERLTGDGLGDVVPVTSGSKGLQLYAAVSGQQPAGTVSDYAKAVAVALERDHPRLVTSRMAKEARPGKVFLDWSQNAAAKTTVSPYSMRGRERPTAAAPRRWDEIEPGLVQIAATEVAARLQADGDLTEPVRHKGRRVPT